MKPRIIATALVALLLTGTLILPITALYVLFMTGAFQPLFETLTHSLQQAEPYAIRVLQGW